MNAWSVSSHIRLPALALAVMVASAHAEGNLRVGLAHKKQVEIRCDGPIQLSLEGGKSPSKELPAGIYTVSVVAAPDLYRAAPLVAGVISTPPAEVIVMAAADPTQSGWKVVLLRTGSEANAARAERDARSQLRGRINSYIEDGYHVVEMGPFPNEYLARQALGKARGMGFPAQVVPAGDSLGYARVDSTVSSGPLASRRLIARGSGAPTPAREPSPSLEVEVPSAPAGETKIKPLDLIPEEELQLEPLPTLPPEELALEDIPEPRVEPVPEPEKAQLAPALGWKPAPGGPTRSVREPEKLDLDKSRLPSPPRRMTPPSSLARPPASARAESAPPGVSRVAPPESAYRRRGVRPYPRRPVGEERPPMALLPKKDEKPAESELKKAPAELPPPPPSGESAEPPRRGFVPDQELSVARPPVREARPSSPRRLEPPKRLAPPPEPVEPRRSPEREDFAFAPKPRKRSIPEVIKSLPIIRLFPWQKPLVQAPPEPALDYESEMESALREPASSEELAREEGELIPESGRMEVSPEIETGPERVADLPPPTPMPFDPERARERAEVEEPRPESLAWSETEEPAVVPMEEPSPATLPKEGEPPVLDMDESLIPSAPGEETTNGAKPFVAVAEGAPSEGPATTAEEPALVTKSRPTTGGRTLTIPQTRPISRAYVRVYDQDGKPVCDPATVVDLAPATGSGLEFNRNGYHGAFQAYAPSDEWLALVNIVDLEDYVSGIVPREIPPEVPFEVLKAQAVMSRNYAIQLAQSGDYAEYGYDIPGMENSDWPYSGKGNEAPSVRLAVEETAGQVLVTSDGALATPVYCFSSGGYVADGQSIWGGSGEPVPEYFEARPDFDPAEVGFDIGPDGFRSDEDLLEDWLKQPPNTYDRDAAGESFRWKKTLSGEELDALVNDYWNNQVGHVRSIRVAERAISGHATRMVIEGSEQTVEARDADTIREALELDSSLILVDDSFGGDWVIYGGGLGHGVGLSQCGAIGLVKRKGANYKQILHFYFSRLALGRRVLARPSGQGA
ncbi:MAG: hypothetical protein GHCLOJNM_01385 [bacterium]|nr:hypothetical protein [bacterium]